MTRRILCVFTVIVLGLSPIGCNGDKSSSSSPRIKGGVGDYDPKISGPVQPGGKGASRPKAISD